MCKAILLLLLWVAPAMGQKIHFDNAPVIDYFLRNLDIIEEVNGSYWVAIPLEQDRDTKYDIMIIDNYPVQFRELPNGNIQLKPVKTKVYVFDFKLKAHGLGEEANDGLVFGRPLDPAQKVKDKLKENREKAKEKKHVDNH